MFLHPVNVRCLVREYGSLEQSPEKISAVVVEIAGYSMSEVRSCLVPVARFWSVINLIFFDMGLSSPCSQFFKELSFCI